MGCVGGDRATRSLARRITPGKIPNRVTATRPTDIQRASYGRFPRYVAPTELSLIRKTNSYKDSAPTELSFRLLMGET